MHFKSDILIVPGLGNSGEGHWQSLWEEAYNFKRIEQQNWDTPVLNDWITVIDNVVTNSNINNVILVAHSLACTTVAAWAKTFNRPIKAALLVAPSDTEAETYPTGTTCFNPMVLHKLPFPSITVMSTNDYYVTAERAAYFAACWGSNLVNIGDAGHINVAAGFGEWNKGLELLMQLDK